MEKQVRLHVRVKAITVNGSVETDSGKVVGTFSRDIPSDRLDEVVTVDEPEPEPLADWERELLSPFPAGLTVSDDGVALNWRGVNYVRQSEPWPTAPLIVADIPNGGRRILYRSCDGEGNYWTFDDDLYTQGDDALTNVIPVRVVPAAEWEALVEAAARRPAAGDEGQPLWWFALLAKCGRELVAATEALGVTE